VGGETAEMPGMYQGEDYDLAGFCVGIVEKSQIIDGSNAKEGDTLIGLASSGPHSNGYSLIRKIIDVSKVDIKSDLIQGIPLAEALLTPTRIYVDSILSLIRQENIKTNALAHITGGGLLENIPRVLPKNTKAVIDTTSWNKLPVFDWLQKNGNVEPKEMYRTFNCGIGMVICVPDEMAQLSIDTLNATGEKAFIIGKIAQAKNNEEKVILKGI
jgi:phosphoribosylformylglycinamidine cyclo-ligase|tara:strand:- start:143 stop:784 length:642 start_codon:yes stop_codon:yes gene_type:complete